MLTVLLLFGCSQTGSTEPIDGDRSTDSFSDSNADSTYAEWIETTLAETYGVSGGEWLIDPDEARALESFRPFSVQSEVVAVGSAQPEQALPFEKALRLEVESAFALAWNSGTIADSLVALKEGDHVLVTFWVRALEHEADRGAVLVQLQERETFDSTVSELIPVTDAWQQIYLRGVVPRTSGAGEAMLFFATGGQQQQIEVGGIAAFNFGQRLALSGLPQTVLHNYAGQEANATWRTAAQQRIEANRMAAIQVEVLDKDGAPITNTNIQVEMRRHAFAFGTAVNANMLVEQSADAEMYRETLLDLDGRGHGFNAAVLENGLKWTRWDAGDGRFRENAIEAVDWLLDRGIRVRGHNLVWPGWSHMPSDLEAKRDDPAYLLERTNRRIAGMLSETQLAGKLYEWDVLNELRTNKDVANSLAASAGFASGEEVYAQWFEAARQADAQMKLFVNDYGQLDNGALYVGQHNHYKHFIQTLIDGGNHVDGIGLQSHLDYPLAGPERLYAILNDFAKYGKDIVITEYDLALAYRNEPDLGEEVAGRYTRDFLTMIFSHPAVDGFLMWGFWDEIHWMDDSPMFRADWSLKPAGQAFVDLVFDAWWTDVDGATDADGLFETRGFLGEYRVTATVDGATKAVDAVVTDAGDTISIVFDGEDTTYSVRLPLVAQID